VNGCLSAREVAKAESESKSMGKKAITIIQGGKTKNRNQSKVIEEQY